MVRVLQVRPAGCLIRAGAGTGTQKREFQEDNRYQNLFPVYHRDG
jgi:hypothetical protein